MAEPQLSVRSSKAVKLAHILAKKEQRTIAQVVERALELYAHEEPPREAPLDFYARLTRDFGTDVDLDALIRDNRSPNPGIEF